ncbi:MAG: tRNA lysidine(34) synthetase TilS [Acidimicrobiia bacterium]|nr:tRNA lysidine(34) synthetase TilS [Acidimicrobiia bacterium]
MRGGFPPGPIVVALSGGADSAVCAWAAVASGCKVRAIIADHGLPESAALVSAAVQIAVLLGVAYEVVPAFSEDASEAGLRDVRYAAIAAAAGADESLVTGHTADDQAETTLGNLLRGAGAAGLAGIPVSRGRWHRPLLGVSREATRAAARELGLPFADDPGNVDAGVRRSRIRTEVIPYLEQLNPSVRDALRRAARLASDDDLVLGGRADAIPVRVAHGEIRLPAAALSTVPTAVASRAVRRGLRVALHPYAGDLGDVAAVLSVAAGEVAACSVSGDWMAVREGPWVTIHRPGVLEPAAAAAIPVPGTARCGRWIVDAVQVDSAPAPSPAQWMLALPAGHGDLSVRSAVAGDTISMGDGSKAVGDALREAGVPARLRAVWPVVEEAGRMVWVIGSRIAAGVTASPGSPATVLRARESV